MLALLWRTVHPDEPLPRRLPAFAAAVAAVRLAALVHDIGRVGVSTAIWDKQGPLSGAEWEQVRLHPYYTQRALARARELTELGHVACEHHERLDGSGYHRGPGRPV